MQTILPAPNKQTKKTPKTNKQSSFTTSKETVGGKIPKKQKARVTKGLKIQFTLGNSL